MKKVVVILMCIFILVGEYTILSSILELFHLEDNLFIIYIILILMFLFNGYMFTTYDEEVIKRKKEENKGST